MLPLGIGVNFNKLLREIRYIAEFKRNLRHLAQRYCNIRNGIDPVLAQFQ